MNFKCFTVANKGSFALARSEGHHDFETFGSNLLCLVKLYNFPEVGNEIIEHKCMSAWLVDKEELTNGLRVNKNIDLDKEVEAKVIETILEDNNPEEENPWYVLMNIEAVSFSPPKHTD